VVAPLEGFLAAAGSRARATVRLAVRVMGWSAFPRRFVRVRPDRRARRIAALERSRFGPLRDVALVLKTLTCFAWARDRAVQEAAGVGPRCSLGPGADDPLWEPVPPPLDRAALEPPAGEVERCDVVVVGSGAGGATAARVLAERGLDVVVLEEGQLHDASTYSTDPLEAIPALYRDGGLTFCEGRPNIPIPVGRCVGGTTVINSGTCLRPPTDVLADWRDTWGVDWATDLDGELEAVERALRVAPVDPATAGRNAELCRLGAESIGASNGPIPRNAGRVACCGTCPTGCAIDAKQAAHVSELPRAVVAGARVRAGVRVERLIVENGRAVGVVGQLDGHGGAPYEVRARAVVLAGGALGTPELLLRQGAFNGHVGRHLRIHPATWVGALYDGEVRGWDGVMQSWYVDEWRDRGLFLEATFTPLPFSAHWMPGAGRELTGRLERFDRLAVIGVHLSERSEGRVRVTVERLRMTYRLTREDAATLRFGIARAADIHFAAGAREVYPQVARAGALAPGEQASLDSGRARPGELRLEAFHPMGTARMGADPRASVVGPSGEAHDLPGLYVADASIFPTALKVNPMITIMACARRIAAGIADRLS
jgi:choline dehydrogenase-like flavoprotein